MRDQFGMSVVIDGAGLSSDGLGLRLKQKRERTAEAAEIGSAIAVQRSDKIKAMRCVDLLDPLPVGRDTDFQPTVRIHGGQRRQVGPAKWT